MSDTPQRFRLRNIGGVLTELKRVYRAGWTGELSWQDASAAARILREIRACIEGDQIEERLAKLESEVMHRTPVSSRPPAGSA